MFKQKKWDFKFRVAIKCEIKKIYRIKKHMKKINKWNSFSKIQIIKNFLNKFDLDFPPDILDRLLDNKEITKEEFINFITNIKNYEPDIILVLMGLIRKLHPYIFEKYKAQEWMELSMIWYKKYQDSSENEAIKIEQIRKELEELNLD